MEDIQVGKIFNKLMATYLEEIFEQPKIINNVPFQFNHEVVKDLKNLIIKINNKEIDQIILTGMGSSLYGSYSLYLFLNKHIHVPISMWSCSELVQQAKNIITNRTLIIATSQSGESVELVKLTELKQKPHTSISITNLKNNTLSNWTNISIFSNAGAENTVSSKTYTAGYAIKYILGSILIDKRQQGINKIKIISNKMNSLFKDWELIINKASKFIEPINTLFFIGRGINFSSSNYSALITAEASKLPSISLSSGQFRHGPIELVRKGFSCVIFYGSKKNAKLNHLLINDISKFGGKCLVIASDNSLIKENKNIKVLRFPSIDDSLYPILEVIPVQLMQIPLANNRGFEPAKFLNASKVTKKE